MAEIKERSVKTRRILERLFRIFLRTVPVLPGPELYDLILDLGKSRSDLDEKISRAQNSLAETSNLIEELELGLEERITKLNRLKKEYEKYSQLAEVEEEKAKAIIQQIELAIGRGKGKERTISLALNIFAGIVVFVLGILLGPYLTKLLGITGQ